MAKATSLTKEQLTLRAQAAAHTSWKNTADPAARTSAARRGFLAKFEDEVDPERKLSPEERARRAAHALSAHMASVSYAASRARKTKRAPKSRRGRGGAA